MNSREDQRLRAHIEEAKKRGLVDQWTEGEGYVTFYVGSVTYGVCRRHANEFLDGLDALRDRISAHLSKSQL